MAGSHKRSTPGASASRATAMTDLTGEIAVVVGASQGIGEAIAQTLAAAGARMAVTSRDGATAEQLAASLGEGHIGLALDVRSTESVDAAAASVLESLGAATILVNNAGINHIGPAESFTDEEWSAVLDVNLTGVFRCCRAFGRIMLAGGRGSIVNISSLSATMGLPGRAPYAASKAGIVGLTHTLGAEWAGRGVRVNAVLPGPVLTPMVADGIARGVLDGREITERTPAGRIGAPGDVGGAVLLLCLPAAGFITAQTLVVDGGYTMYGSAHGSSEIISRVEGASRKDE
ncbi:MAG: SDR family oxidoreductase [Thermoleophilia bacterium]|nr:SDR family oxidoreductase [Thermoleophilia bacterium]